MAQEIKTKIVGKYNGHNVKSNKSVDLKFVFAYSEIEDYIKLHQFLNENTTVVIRKGNETPKKLGMFMLQEYKVDHDGECSVKMNSSEDFVETNNLNGLSGELLQVLFKANVQDENDK